MFNISTNLKGALSRGNLTNLPTRVLNPLSRGNVSQLMTPRNIGLAAGATALTGAVVANSMNQSQSQGFIQPQSQGFTQPQSQGSSTMQNISNGLNNVSGQMNSTGDGLGNSLGNTMNDINSQINGSLGSLFGGLSGSSGQSSGGGLSSIFNMDEGGFSGQNNRQVSPQQQQNQGFTQPTSQQSFQQSTQQVQPMQHLVQQAPPIQQPVPSVPTRAHKFGNGIVIQRGQKSNIQASNIKVCMGWNIKDPNCDLDVSAFMLDQTNKVIGDDWFVFYGQRNSPDNSMNHLDSDNNDDGIISINLGSVDNRVKKIVFVVTINEALEHNYNFSMVENAYIRIVNSQDNNELLRFMLTEYYSNVTSMMVGEVYNHNGQWKLNPIGDGVAKDLAGLCQMYGVEVE